MISWSSVRMMLVPSTSNEMSVSPDKTRVKARQSPTVVSRNMTNTRVDYQRPERRNRCEGTPIPGSYQKFETRSPVRTFQIHIRMTWLNPQDAQSLESDEKVALSNMTEITAECSQALPYIEASQILTVPPVDPEATLIESGRSRISCREIVIKLLPIFYCLQHRRKILYECLIVVARHSSTHWYLHV
jgi:hypothetical protein